MKLKELTDTIYIDPRKLTRYALCLENPKGKDKALMFQTYLGYTLDNYQNLLYQIQTRAPDAEAIALREDIHGRRYRVDIEVEGTQPGQKENVRTGWLVLPDASQARLITAYIKRKQ